MKNTKLVMPNKVFYGENTLEKIKDILENKVSKVAIFTSNSSKRNGLLKKIQNILNQLCIQNIVFSDMPVEPSYSQVQEIVDNFKKEQCDFIIGIGGGSVLDVAKLASILNTDKYSIKDLLKDSSIAFKQIETLLIPTTFGSGSEATPNAIVLVPEDNLKVGIVNFEMIADYVILDPITTISLPFKLASSTGIDALCHNLECFTSNKANDISNTFALEGLKLIIENIENAINTDDLESKMKMLLGSFYGGVAITTSGTTAIHALSYPLGGKFHVPHGISNAILLVPVLNFNEQEIKEELEIIFDKVFNFNYQNTEKVEKSKYVISEIENIVKRLNIPTSYKEFGVSVEDIEELVDSGMKVTRLLVNNKRKITPKDAELIYRQVI